MLYGPIAISPQPISLADNAGIVKHRSCKNLLHITRKRVEQDARRLPEHGHMTHSERRTRNTLREDFNPLWYLIRVRNKSRNSRHCVRTLGCTRLFPPCLSGFQLREPELSENQRIHRASLSLSDISVNLPHRVTLCPVSGGAGRSRARHPNNCIAHFFFTLQQEERGPFARKLAISAIFIHLRSLFQAEHFTVVAESLHVLPETRPHMDKAYRVLWEICSTLKKCKSSVHVFTQENISWNKHFQGICSKHRCDCSWPQNAVLVHGSTGWLLM